MRHVASALFGAVLLAGCAAWRTPAVPLAEIGIGEADVLAAERENLRLASAHGNRLGMQSIERVDSLRCDTSRLGVQTPRCRYRLFYTDLRGVARVRTRKDSFFGRGENGRWEFLIVV